MLEVLEGAGESKKWFGASRFAPGIVLRSGTDQQFLFLTVSGGFANVHPYVLSHRPVFVTLRRKASGTDPRVPLSQEQPPDRQRCRGLYVNSSAKEILEEFF